MPDTFNNSRAPHRADEPPWFPWFRDPVAEERGAPWNEIASWMFADAGTFEALAARHAEISPIRCTLFAIPTNQQLMQQIAKPLFAAAVDYTLGNYLGTIALCGLVAEMAAGLVYDMSVVENVGRADLVKAFGKCRQPKRLAQLLGGQLLTLRQHDDLLDVHKVRVAYYHDWSKDQKDQCLDAKKVYAETVNVVRDVIGQSIHNGALRLNAKMLSYVRKAGATGIDEVD